MILSHFPGGIRAAREERFSGELASRGRSAADERAEGSAVAALDTYRSICRLSHQIPSLMVISLSFAVCVTIPARFPVP